MRYLFGVVIILIALLGCNIVVAFQQISTKTAPYSYLGRAQPLKTAGSHGSIFHNAIPRLEPGLRIYRKQISDNFLVQHSAFEISPFSLDRLKEFEHIPEHLRVFGRDRESLNMGKLFAAAVQRVRLVSESILATMKRFMTATLLLATSLGSSVLPAFSSAGSHVHRGASAIYRSVSGRTPATFKRIGISAASIAAAVTSSPVGAQASALKKYADLSPTQRLATTPLYYVSDARGNSYLQPDSQSGNSDQRCVVYFMSSEDANQYLEEMAQTNSYSANNFRITTVSMEKVVNQIQSKKQSRKLGRYPMSMVLRIQPSSRQYANAEKIVGEKGAAKLQQVSIPMFSAKGLLMKRPNGEVVTPYYFAYEDLLDDWEKMTSDGKDAAASQSAAPRVVVHDFTEVMCLAKGITMDSIKEYAGTNDRLSAIKSVMVDTEEVAENAGIVPPRREIDMIRRYYRNEGAIRNEYNKAKYLGPKN